MATLLQFPAPALPKSRTERKAWQVDRVARITREGLEERNVYVLRHTVNGRRSLYAVSSQGEMLAQLWLRGEEGGPEWDAAIATLYELLDRFDPIALRAVR